VFPRASSMQSYVIDVPKGLNSQDVLLLKAMVSTARGLFSNPLAHGIACLVTFATARAAAVGVNTAKFLLLSRNLESPPSTPKGQLSSLKPSLSCFCGLKKVFLDS
jgi:hypothetical protein